MLKTIKLIHTIIWVVMAAAISYILYAGVTNTFNSLLWFCIILIFIETIVLLLNRWTCPLTPVAGRYTSDRKDNFDIYLPLWLAKHNKTIFGILFALGLVIVIVNLIKTIF